jgi:hypothetical protein
MVRKTMLLDEFLGRRPSHVGVLRQLTSAGSSDPVTSLIPHHRLDWISQDFSFLRLVGWIQQRGFRDMYDWKT